MTTGRPHLAPVQVGIVYVEDVAAFGAATGMDLQSGDQRRQAQVTVDWVNTHGGFAGHPVVPVFHGINTMTSTPYSQLLEEACADFTQDHKVVAAMFVAAPVQNDLARCLDKKGIPYLAGGNYPEGSRDYREIPHLIGPFQLGAERGFRTLMSYLFATSFFKPNDRVGVLLTDNVTGTVDAYRTVVAPMLTSHKIPYSTEHLTWPGSTPEIGNAVAQTQSAALKFRSEGVTTVLFVGPGTEGTFMQYAESQQWRPRYALTTFDLPWIVYSDGSGAPASQLAGAVGVGWMPVVDVGTYGKAPTLNAPEILCRQIEAKSGVIDGNVVQYSAMSFCDGVLFLQAAANAAGPANITGSGMLTGYEALGASHLSALTLNTSISRTQHDGADAYRPLRFDSACPCFTYSGSSRTVPPL